MIPGLGDAEFARLGGIHRNTFINSPKLLNETLQLNQRPAIRFAGQITGVEGYLESAAIGLLCGRFAGGDARGVPANIPPRSSALGALLNHITTGHLASDSNKKTFQPMNINFGLFENIDAPKQDPSGRRLRGKERGLARKRILAERALAELDAWECDNEAEQLAKRA